MTTVISTRLEIISVRVSEKARSGKFRHHIETKWFFLISHRKSPTQPPSRRRRILRAGCALLIQAAMEAGRRPGVGGRYVMQCGDVTSGSAEELLKGVNGVSTSPSQLGSITRLRLCPVSRHRGQRLFLQVRGGCQTTTTVSLKHLKEAALPTD
jgi:hypothetical protein